MTYKKKKKKIQAYQRHAVKVIYDLKNLRNENVIKNQCFFVPYRKDAFVLFITKANQISFCRSDRTQRNGKMGRWRREIKKINWLYTNWYRRKHVENSKKAHLFCPILDCFFVVEFEIRNRHAYNILIEFLESNEIFVSWIIFTNAQKLSVSTHVFKLFFKLCFLTTHSLCVVFRMFRFWVSKIFCFIVFPTISISFPALMVSNGLEHVRKPVDTIILNES